MQSNVELRKEFMVSIGDYRQLFSDGKCNAMYAEWLEITCFVRETEIDRLQKEIAESSTSPNKSSLRLPDVKQCIEHAMSKLGDDYFNVTPAMLIGCVRRFIAGELEEKK